MASALDDELARFEAEMKALEASQTTEEEAHVETGPVARVLEATDKRETKDSTAPPRNRKVETEVIFAPPKPSVEMAAISEAANSIPAALSGFPLGTSGTEASFDSRTYQEQNQRPSSGPLPPRLDMYTGCPLPAEEQDQLAKQQSIYDYNPHKQQQHTSQASSSTVAAHSTTKSKKKAHVRMAGGNVWTDATLADWPDNDFRLFCGDLGNEVSDELLVYAFSGYPTFQRAKVVRDKHSQKTKGYGFISFSDALDCAKAMREMNGKYIGNRPVKLQKSKWEERDLQNARKRNKKRKKNHLFV